GGPQNTPHIQLQQFLAPGESRELKVILDQGGYRWRVPRLAGNNPAPRTVEALSDSASGRGLFSVSVEAAGQVCSVTIGDQGLRVQPDEVQPGVTAIHLCNESARPQVILLEQTVWSDQ